MNKNTQKEIKRFGTAMMFLMPNLLGFLIFVLVPLIASIALAFTNWDLTQHNMYQDNPINFVGLDNFILLFTEDDFVR
ncbi:MAG: sugar ABC transporter permease, partial [Planctomycetes bacterium]|nr:sugar ABC transporter permease [Planctomycetota bacterium]